MSKTIPTSSELLKKYGLDAKKSFGQNFILDSNLTDKIVKSAGDLTGFEVLEVGPGPSCLTLSILKQNPQKLTVIEKDSRFVPLLEEIKTYYPHNFTIINDDALTVDEKALIAAKPFKIIANLPYNVGTELIFKWLEDYQNTASITVMLQKEVVERIVAKSGSKKYGRLSVMINFFCESRHLFDVKPTCFTPPPKVTSAMVQIIPKAQPIMDVDAKALSRICAAAFGQRRKMLRSSLKSITKDAEALLKACDIDPTLRAEQLSLEQFGLLAQNLNS